MTKSVKKCLFSLSAFFSLFVIALLMTHSVQAGRGGGSSFPPNESNYWNMGNSNMTLPSNGNGDIEHCTVESNNLKAPYDVAGFNVYTPPSYNNSNQRYPVIYLLHGANGNEYNYFSYFNNSTFFNANSGSLPSRIDNGLASEAIIVFVNGGAASFYDDWANSTGNGPSSSFPIMSESVIMEDVIPFVDANFRTIANRSGRGIEGFSMGGRGAIKLAFTYPEQFCSTIAYAGAAYEAVPSSVGTDHPRFGPMEPAYQISTITANHAASIRSYDLQIRLVDGAGDGAAGQGGGSDALHTQLNSLSIAHEYVPSQNGVNSHDWGQYHQATGAYGLNFHFQCFAAAKSADPAPIILGGIDEFTYLPIVVKPNAIPVGAGSCN